MSKTRQAPGGKGGGKMPSSAQYKSASGKMGGNGNKGKPSGKQQKSC
jgi:hypothetical protein